jgi:hypothetical protein
VHIGWKIFAAIFVECTPVNGNGSITAAGALGGELNVRFKTEKRRNRGYVRCYNSFTIGMAKLVWRPLALVPK